MNIAIDPTTLTETALTRMARVADEVDRKSVV